MITALHQQYNQAFTQERYQGFLNSIYETYLHKPPFRIAETPVFLSNELKRKLEEACHEINEVIAQPNFKELTQDAIKHPSMQVPGEDGHTRFLQMDFGICVDENGELIPQLIEAQGFPSLYFFQNLLVQRYKEHFDIPSYMSSHLNGMSSEAYIQLLRDVVVGDFHPQHVVLLEVEPEKQATYIDFLCAAHHLGIKILCISNLKKRGKDLYYLNEEGEEVAIHRIFNRVIFDELDQRDDIKREFSFQDEVNVEWVGHPNWFFRISKYTLPLLKSKYVPESLFLHQLNDYPSDLENYVLKPLYSFAGSGVKINITKEDLDSIQDRENYILQRKVSYMPIVPSPDEPVKCEVRMLMLWEEGAERPRIVNNLVRLSKGEMIGVKYNKDKDWVGASVGFFEKDEVFAEGVEQNTHRERLVLA